MRLKSEICLCLIICCLFFLRNETFAQEIERPTAPDTVKQAIKLQRPQFTPFIAPVVSPEVDLMITIGGLFTFKLKPLDSILYRSSIPFSVGYSTNGSLNVNFRPFIYGKNDKWRIFGDLWAKNMPDNYWGVGYENGKNPPKPDSTTAYHRWWWQIDLDFIRKVAPNLFVGIKMDINETKASELNQSMQEDPYVINQGTSFRNSGLGATIQYDSRDLSVNAYSGLYLNLTGTVYRHFLNGTTDFEVYFLDYRQYKTIKRPGRTLAWMIQSQIGTSEIPWTDMSMVGTPFNLRGYTWGRYRDKAMALGLVEYRHMFMRKTPNKKGSYNSHHGFVTWVGTGSVVPTLTSNKNWLPNVGVGYRFEVQSRMNVRLDFGIGNDTNAFYVSFNEAF